MKWRMLSALGAICLVIAQVVVITSKAEAVQGAQAQGQTIAYLDLQPKANQKLKDNFHSDEFAGNNLADLPTGKQTFAGVKFTESVPTGSVTQPWSPTSRARRGCTAAFGATVNGIVAGP